jgi:hypothetical protein
MISESDIVLKGLSATKELETNKVKPGKIEISSYKTRGN